ncbi:MAG: hypothetical protein ACRD1R_19120 [Acidobacteriota bacterium]
MSVGCDLLIACALKKEAAALRRHIDSDCEIIATGLGRQTTQLSLQEYFARRQPSLFIFTGTAGQLDPSLEMGQIVCPEIWELSNGPMSGKEEVVLDKSVLQSLQSIGYQASGRGITVGWPVLRAQDRLRLFERTGASICDLEAVAALKTAADLSIPALALKVVSDTHESGILGFWRNFDTNMRTLANHLSRLIGVIRDR